ncbi:MAG: EamA family transporter [Solirubrobacterales bacterium]|nr:EamA family transporter [Solirubrobacterales bacterium]
MAVRDGSPSPAVAGGLPVLDRVPPIGIVVAGISTIQFGAALAATLFDDLGASGTSLLRLGFAGLIMAVLVRPDPRGHSTADLRLIAAFGLCLGFMNLTFYEALERLPLGVAVTIEFAGPLGVAVFTSRRRLDLLWAGLAALGIVLLADPFGDSLDPLGLALILAAAGFWASYILLAQRAGKVFPGAQGVALAMMIAALVPIIPGVAQGGAELLEPQWLAIGAAVALMSSVIPYTLETEALRRLPANVFGVLMSLEPALAALAGFIVLGQALGGLDLAAMALVVTASIGVSRTGVPAAPEV